MLKGRKVLLTRAADQQKELAEKIQYKGGIPIGLPMIELKMRQALNELHMAFNQFEKYDWLIFTSVNSVKFFFKAAEDFGLKLYFYPNLKIATVGEKTKLVLEQLGYRTNFVPIEFTAAVLAANMDENIAGKNILLPRSAKAADDYLKVFDERSALVDAIPLYDNFELMHPKDHFLQTMGNGLDYLTFMSGSAVRAFVKNMQAYDYRLKNESVVCIGPSTAKVATTLGLKVDLIARPYTIEGMIEGMNKIKAYV